jgi:hypothetical protein
MAADAISLSPSIWELLGEYLLENGSTAKIKGQFRSNKFQNQ